MDELERIYMGYIDAEFDRYLVLKTKDISEILNHEETVALINIRKKIDNARAKQHRDPLEAVVIEHDWPMYEEVWQLVEDWVQQQKDEGDGT